MKYSAALPTLLITSALITKSEGSHFEERRGFFSLQENLSCGVAHTGITIREAKYHSFEKGENKAQRKASIQGRQFKRQIF